jgi:hypothetical protein
MRTVVCSLADSEFSETECHIYQLRLAYAKLMVTNIVDIHLVVTREEYEIATASDLGTERARPRGYVFNLTIKV